MKDCGRDPVGMVGNSAAFLAMVELTSRVAQRDATVLVEGETGTGKELAARAIHYNGPRRKGPFIPCNCGAIPESLVESELFGHRQGAFTDAKQASTGIIFLAHGGTLFLDEVDSLSPKAQVTLLRFLQERTIRRVGETMERAVDVRVVAASSRTLEGMVERGLFRSDLFYRLNIMYVMIPPLRERGADIELLAAHFIAKLSRRYNGPSTLDAASIAWLHTQPWPGNVRQLENFLEREYLLGEGLAALRFSVLAEPACEPELKRWNYRAAKGRVVESFNRRYLDELMRSSRPKSRRSLPAARAASVTLPRVKRFGDANGRCSAFEVGRRCRNSAQFTRGTRSAVGSTIGRRIRISRDWRCLRPWRESSAQLSRLRGGVKVTEARRHAARPPSRERRSMPRGRATRPRQQSVSACRLAS